MDGRAQLDEERVRRIVAQLASACHVQAGVSPADVRADPGTRNGKANGTGVNGAQVWSRGVVAPGKRRAVKHPSAISRVAGLARDFMAHIRCHLGEVARVLVRAERSNWTHAALACSSLAAIVVALVWR